MKHSLLILLFFSLSNSVSAQEITPTWSDDVACLVYTYCTGCHNTNGVAPFPLETYEQVVAHKDLIHHEVIVEERMPPYPATEPHATFANDISLKEDEKEMFKTWLEGDQEMGDLANAPEPPVYEAEFAIADPNFVVELEPYTVREVTGADQYRCYVFPVNFETDMYIKGLEFVPDNPKAVHHILLYHDTGNTATSLDAADPEEGYVCFGGIGTNNARLLGGWAPGGQPSFYTHGSGILIPAKTNLVVQVHYPIYAVGEVDASSIRMELTSEPQREIRVDPILFHFPPVLQNGPINVGPNEVKEYFQSWTTPFKMTVSSISPHAHLICTHLESWLEKPDGTTQQLITIPNWDFEWQYYYPYKTPIIVEPGTTFKGKGIYDNTINNPNNPSIPPQRVQLGEATGDEMMLFFISWSRYEEGDEDLVYSSEDHVPWYNECSSAVLTDTDNATLTEVSLFPNPVQDYILIDSDTKFEKVMVFDVMGNIVLDKFGDNIQKVNIKDLVPGSYVVQLDSVEGTVTKKIVIQ